MPEQGKITATVDVLTRPHLDDLTKVRAVVWSGRDFKAPHIVRGALFEDRAEAESVAEAVRDAFRVAGIPIEGDEPQGDAQQPLLPAVREGQEYDLR